MLMENDALPISAGREALASAQGKWGGEVKNRALRPVGPALTDYLAMLAEHDAIPPAIRDGVPWFLAYVDPCKELMVAKGAPEQRLFGYSPQVQTEVKIGGHKFVNGQKVWRTRTANSAYIKNYVFIQDDGRDDCQFRIKGIKYVQRLVSGAGYVACCPDWEIKRLRALEVDGFIPAMEANVEGVGVGDTIRIVDGAFTDFMALVLELVSRNRISIELQVFGSLPRVEIALHQVELVSRKVETPPRR